MLCVLGGGKDVYHWDRSSGFGHACERGLHDPLLADLREDHYFVASRGSFFQHSAIFEPGNGPDFGAFKTASASHRNVGSYTDARFFHYLSHEPDSRHYSFKARIPISIIGEKEQCR